MAQLDWSDPEVRKTELAKRKAARAGKKYTTAPGIAAVQKAYQADPKTKLALNAIAQGASTAPVAEGKYAYVDGIARVLGGMAGKKLSDKQLQTYGEEEADTLDQNEFQADAKVQREQRAAAAAAMAAGQAPALTSPTPESTAPPPPPPPQGQAQLPSGPGSPVAAPLDLGAAAAALAPQTPSGPPPGTPMAPPGPQIAPGALQGGTPGGGNPFPVSRNGSVSGGSGNDVLAGGDLSLAGGRDILKAAGARITSGYRSPTHNKDVGGVNNSFHTRGTPDNPQAYDFVPKPGESMRLLEAKARKAFPGFDVINEGDHVHVEPSDRMMASNSQAAGGEGTEVLQGGAGKDNIGGVPDPFAPPTEEAVEALPEPVKRPERPKSVAARKSELLEAAYDIMRDKNKYQYDEGREMFSAGLSEQDKMNEAAAAREQGMIDAEYGTDMDLFKASQGRVEAGKIAATAATVASNRGRTDDWVKYRREEAEKAKDRANQVLIESMGNGAALAAAQAKIKDAAMPQNVASKVTDLGGRLDALTFLSTDANEKYFGKWANNMDIATNKFVGNNPKLAGWWETYSSLVNDVRKGTFGATLTPHEKAEFEKTVVTPNTNPKLAIENVKKMHGILEVAAGRQGRAISSKYGAGNVTEALGRDPTSLGVGMNPYAPKTAPTAPTKPAPAGVDAKTWQYMTPEERAKF